MSNPHEAEPLERLTKFLDAVCRALQEAGDARSRVAGDVGQDPVTLGKTRARRKPERIDVQHLTIVGDRQHGKSHALVTLATDLARCGESVYYECGGRKAADERMNDFVRRYGDADVGMVMRELGHRRIVFRGGGTVHFDLPRVLDAPAITTHVIDDAAHAEPLEGVRRVIRAQLR